MLDIDKANEINEYEIWNLSDIMKIMEVIFNVVIVLTSYVLYIIFIVLLVRVKPFHHNLRYLIIHLCISYMIVSFGVFITIVYYIMKDVYMWKTNEETNYIVTAVRWFQDIPVKIGLLLVNFTLLSILYERSMAVRMYWIYENSTSSRVVYSLIIVQWIVVVILTILDKLHILNSLILAATTCIMQFPAIFFFIHLFRKSKGMYNSCRELSLSGRYQLVENIKTTLLLRTVISFLFGTFFLAICFFVLSRTCDGLLAEMCKYLFYATLAVQVYVLPWLVISSTIQLKREIWRIFCCNGNKKTGCSAVVPLKTLNGENMIVTADEQRNVYFNAYRNAWNTQ